MPLLLALLLTAIISSIELFSLSQARCRLDFFVSQASTLSEIFFTSPRTWWTWLCIQAIMWRLRLKVERYNTPRASNRRTSPITRLHSTGRVLVGGIIRQDQRKKRKRIFFVSSNRKVVRMYPAWGRTEWPQWILLKLLKNLLGRRLILTYY